MTWNPAIPPIRYSGNPTIAHGGASWYDSQMYDFNPLLDPTDSSKLLMYVSGMAAPATTGVQSIGLFRANVSTPHTWTENGGSGNGQVLLPSGSGFDADHVRIGCVVDNPNTSELWFYYAGLNGGAPSVGLAKAPYASPAVLTRFGSSAILTSAGNGHNDGGNWIQMVSVTPPWVSGLAYWVMIYEYRDGVISSISQYRIATSPDGETWTKTVSGDILGAKPDGTAFLTPEFHQLRKIGSTYYLIFESGSAGTGYGIYVATASTPEGPFVSLADGLPILAPSGISGTFDYRHVATPFLINIGGIERLFYCGTTTSDPYSGLWSAGIADFNAEAVAVLTEPFTAANGTALTALSSAPTAVVGTFQVQSNKAQPNSNADDDQIVWDVGVSDYELTVDIVVRGDVTNASLPGILVRFVDSTHLWLIHPTPAGMFLYQNNGGYASVQGPIGAFTDNVSYQLKVVCQGCCITVYVDGVEQLLYTSALTGVTATKVGLRTGKSGTPVNKCSWDNLVVQKFSEIQAASTGGGGGRKRRLLIP